MAHPLNLPRYDENKGRIVAGYGILQPRVAIGLLGTNRSRYARMWGSDAGIDPYTALCPMSTRTSSVKAHSSAKAYTTLTAFERVLKERFPDNRILSHDLIEGCYVRSGLVSDVQLYEEYPSRLQRGRESSPSLGSGRLAASAMAPSRRSRPQQQLPEKPAFFSVTVEAP